MQKPTYHLKVRMTSGRIDYLDMSHWDYRKEPLDPRFAGKIISGGDVRRAFKMGVNFLLIGRGAILPYDFVRPVAADPEFEPIARPVAPAHLVAEGPSDGFIGYMRNWKGFVAA